MVQVNLIMVVWLFSAWTHYFLLSYSPHLSAYQWCIKAGALWYRSTLPTLFPCYIFLPIARYHQFFMANYLIVQIFNEALPFHYVIVTLLTTLLLLLACLDWYHFLLPNPVVAMIMALGLFMASSLTHTTLIVLIITSFSCYSLLWLMNDTYYRLKGHTGLGRGDMKLLAALALWFYLDQLLLVVFLASTSALLFCGYRYHNRLYQRPIVIPFGTFLSLSALGCFFFFHDLPLLTSAMHRPIFSD